MRKILAFFLALFTLAACAQNPNPQQSFNAQVQLAAPNLWLNYNDATANFKDSVSGLSFAGTVITSAKVGNVLTVQAGTTYVSTAYLWPVPLPVGPVLGVSAYFATAPTAGQLLYFGVATNNGSSSFTFTNSFSVVLTHTTGWQTFYAGTDYTAFNSLSNQVIGMLVPSGTQVPGMNNSSSQNVYTFSSTTIPSGPKTYASSNYVPEFYATIGISPATSIALQQPGFDNTNPINYSAGFPWNSYNSAPNNTLGAIDWNTPWTMLVHIDRPNWNRTGALVLASKGDISSTSNNWWKITLSTAGLSSQICFKANGYASSYGAMGGVCTKANPGDMPNGFNYDIIVMNAGTGATGVSPATNTFSIFVNGLGVGYLSQSNPYAYGIGFGTVSFTVTGGTGYANLTNYTSTGGGANCVQTGVMLATSGVPTIVQTSNSGINSGCTSAPTIVLTSPTGTGAVITATPTGASMNDSTLPMMAPGYVSSGVYSGIDQSDSTQTATNVDELAVFPTVLTMNQITQIFTQTKFYQAMIYPSTFYASGAPKVIFDNNGCGGDPSGDYALAMTLGAAKLGILQIVGLVDDDAAASGSNSVGWYRQMLDRNGLADVPVSVDTSVGAGASNANCQAAQLSSYNANTPQDPAAYESPTTMYRQILAANPTTPVYVLLNGPINAYAAFLQSPADGISSLTGLQLQAQDAANGGYTNVQGGACGVVPQITACSSTTTGAGGSNILDVPAAGQYWLANNGTMPVYFLGGGPAVSGPGPRYNLPSTDPFYLAMNYIYVNNGGFESRPGWNTQQTAQIISPYFWGGVQVTYSGGTGYANATPFTSTGGGTYCKVAGIMTASGGVPNGIEYTWGAPFSNAGWTGALGYGCTSAPTLVLTAPTGTGVALSAYPTQFCMDDEITYPGSVWTEHYTSATCTNKYMEQPSQFASGDNAPIYEMFQNSILNMTPTGQPRAQ